MNLLGNKFKFGPSSTGKILIAGELHQILIKNKGGSFRHNDYMKLCSKSAFLLQLPGSLVGRRMCHDYSEDILIKIYAYSDETLHT